jgi:hypothetical protein
MNIVKPSLCVRVRVVEEATQMQLGHGLIHRHDVGFFGGGGLTHLPGQRLITPDPLHKRHGRVGCHHTDGTDQCRGIATPDVCGDFEQDDIRSCGRQVCVRARGEVAHTHSILVRNGNLGRLGHAQTLQAAELTSVVLRKPAPQRHKLIGEAADP